MDAMRTACINMDDMIEYVEKMTIQKAFRGYDCADVYDKIITIQRMFLQYIDEYEKIIEEKEATISELSSLEQKEGENLKEGIGWEKELISKIEAQEQKMSQMDAIIKNLELKLQEDKEIQLKLNRELDRYKMLLQKYEYADRSSNKIDESVQKAHAGTRSARVRFDTELESLRLREQQKEAKDKHEIQRQRKEAAIQELLHDLRQVKDCVTYLDKTLRDGMQDVAAIEKGQYMWSDLRERNFG